jgi:hypothetical protein
MISPFPAQSIRAFHKPGAHPQPPVETPAVSGSKRGPFRTETTLRSCWSIHPLMFPSPLKTRWLPVSAGRSFRTATPADVRKILSSSLPFPRKTTNYPLAGSNRLISLRAPSNPEEKKPWHLRIKLGFNLSLHWVDRSVSRPP